MDGNGALFGTLQGNTRDVLHKFTVDLPKVILEIWIYDYTLLRNHTVIHSN